MALLTKGFASVRKKYNHFKRHGYEFGAKDADTYEQLADAFLAKPPTATMQICTRVDGDIVRYDTATGEFGIMSVDSFIRTYFSRPNGTPAEFASNLRYFRNQC